MNRNTKGGRGKANSKENLRICILKTAGVPNTHIARLYGMSDPRVIEIYQENVDKYPELRVITAVVDNLLAKV